jgi:hypothetical protein
MKYAPGRDPGLKGAKEVVRIVYFEENGLGDQENTGGRRRRGSGKVTWKSFRIDQSRKKRHK